MRNTSKLRLSLNGHGIIRKLIKNKWLQTNLNLPPISSRLRWCCMLAGIGLCCQWIPHVSAQLAKPNVTSDRYIVNQTFGGQAFFKDNNVWVYTPAFAETFGMPSENVDASLKGIEAAAFRVEDRSYQTCGMGGKAENCKDEYRCMTDIYVDERKNPLPWATEQQADWFADYNSLKWLRTPSEKGITPSVPQNVIPNAVVNLGTLTLRPFVDPQSRREANYFQNGDTPFTDDINYNLVMVYGYKRQAIAGLTSVTLSYRCDTANSQKPVVTFRLESREKIFSPPLQRFHEFQLPEAFGRKIDQSLQARFARDREYYKKLLNMK